MSEATFKPGQLVRLKDPATLTPTVGAERSDVDFWELIEGIPLYYKEFCTTDDETGKDFPHKASVVGVFQDVLMARPRYEEYTNYTVLKGTEEWHFRDGELEAIPDE